MAYLRRGLRRDGTYEGVGEWDVTDHQWILLDRWARSEGLSLPSSCAPEKEGGREHDVRFDPANKCWLKFTKKSAAGYVVEMHDGRLSMMPAKSLQYLERWRLFNYLFFDDVDLVGIRTERPYHQIVVSQRDCGDIAPTWEEIDGVMQHDYGLRRLVINEELGGYEARAYILKRFAVFDVRPVNCARSASGVIVPLT